MELGKGYEMETGWGVPLGTAMTKGNLFYLGIGNRGSGIRKIKRL